MKCLVRLSADVKFLEWDRYNSKNPYSATKAAAEELLIHIP